MEKKQQQDDPYVIGLDFGSDSVRALLVNARTGAELSSGVADYPRWKNGLYCQPAQSQFRHHPRDYLESMTLAVQAALAQVDDEIVRNIAGIGVDSTGSTPAPVDEEGRVLALLPEFEENPNAMFILWKDHTSVPMAERINQLAHSNDFPDYTRYIGGVYSSEWFWAKAAWVSEQDPDVARQAYSWVELCDWVPAILSDNQHPARIRRGICAAGHKLMWHTDWGGLPPESFLTAISPTLAGLRDRMYQHTYTADQPAGTLSEAWAEKLGLNPGITVAVGAFDCHMGAVGAGAGTHDLVKVIGTSTCDILMVEPALVAEKAIRGICGQVRGSALPEMTALEAGQSAFGDIYAWYKRLLLAPLHQFLSLHPDVSFDIAAYENALLPQLAQEAQQADPADHHALAVDWHNGRRTPDANQRLKGAIAELNLGSTSADLFAALVESTAHGAKAIVDCFVDQGIEVKRLIAIGGISQKSPYVIQTCADVIGKEIIVAASQQCCALGAGIFAAVAAGIYPSTAQAQQQMASPVLQTYTPDPAAQALRQPRYQKYRLLGQSLELLSQASLSPEQPAQEEK